MLILFRNGFARRLVCRYWVLGSIICIANLCFAQSAGILYQVQTHFGGVLKESFEKELLSYQMQNRPVFHLSLLKERARKDVAIIEQKLRTMGYFKACACYSLIEKQEGILLFFSVDPGPVFLIKKIQFFIKDQEAPLQRLTEASMFQKCIGQATTFSTLAELEQKALKWLKSAGFPYAQMHEKELIVDHTTCHTTFRCTLDTGPMAFFGDVAFKGAPGVPVKFLKNRITFQKGDLFDDQKIESTRKTLVSTRLFSSVKIEMAQNCDAQRCVPITIKLKPVPAHLVSVGAHFSTFQTTDTDQNRLQGLKGRFSFTRFNCFERGDQLQLRFSGSPPMRTRLNTQGPARHNFTIECELIEPDAFFPLHTLASRIATIQETTTSFFRRGVTASTLWEASVGAAQFIVGPTIERFRVEERGRYTYALMGLSAEIMGDTTDNPLDPKGGVRLSLSIHPQAGEIIQPDQRTKRGLFVTKARLSTYYSLGSLKQYTIAGWIGVRQVLGQAFSHIPADKKLYAGGNLSVRGFAYQYAGPFDQSKQYPTGGRSVLEWGVEPRISLTEDLSVALFAEGAKVSRELFPLSEDAWFTGIGFGFRYVTQMGPLRADFAIPLRRRQYIDSKLQFMISIGQSF
ncbi:MAG: BamA/TamA family outer membrane protein [Holosporales bacterium]|jgi:translocation and assembly module TamA|nr:BamA/TamA family outer membrane protein [Holosporales bacterium]